MPRQVTLRGVVVWLASHDFVEQSGGKSGLRTFANDRGKVTVRGHGPSDLTKSDVSALVKRLVELGYDLKVVRAEL